MRRYGIRWRLFILVQFYQTKVNGLSGKLMFSSVQMILYERADAVRTGHVGTAQTFN